VTRITIISGCSHRNSLVNQDRCISRLQKTSHKQKAGGRCGLFAALVSGEIDLTLAVQYVTF
jgi:aminopeptidase C